MRYLVLVSAAIVFLAGCSQSPPTAKKPTSPPKWTEEEIASYDHFMASLALVGRIKEEMPKLKEDPAGTRRLDAMCQELLKEAELVDSELLAKAHPELPRIFEQWYLPWLKDQFMKNRPRPGSPAYGRYALKQWNAWCKANWKKVHSPHEVAQSPGNGEPAKEGEGQPAKDRRSVAASPPRWTEDEDAGASTKKDHDKTVRSDDEDTPRLEPKYAFAYYNRGNSWWTKKEFDRAIEDYNVAIRLDPKYALAYRGRGFAWFYKEEYDQALKDFDEVLRLDPKEGYAVIYGYFAARRLGRGAVANRFLDDAVPNLNSGWPYPVVRFLRGGIDEAQLLKLADNGDKRTEAHCYLGLHYAIKGRKREALDHFRWVTEHGNPSFAEHTIAEAELLERRP